MQTQRNGFIVLQVLGHGSYQPIFHGDDGMMFFEHEFRARMEIEDTIKSVDEAIANGDMDENSKMTTEDYEIVSATIINPEQDPKGQKIICFFDTDQYEMHRSEDDWHRVNHVVVGDEQIALLWHKDDIIVQADQLDIKLSDKAAIEILKEIKNRYDESIGVNWDVISVYINDYVEEHKNPSGEGTKK